MFFATISHHASAGRVDPIRVEIVAFKADDLGIRVDGLNGCEPDVRHKILYPPAPWIERRPRDSYMSLIATEGPRASARNLHLAGQRKVEPAFKRRLVRLLEKPRPRPPLNYQTMNRLSAREFILARTDSPSRPALPSQSH